MREPERGSSPWSAPVAVLAVSSLFALSMVLVGIRAAVRTDGVFVNNGEALWHDNKLTVQWPTAGVLPQGAEILTIQGHSPEHWVERAVGFHRLTGSLPVDGKVDYVIRDAGGGVHDVAVLLHPYPVGYQVASNWATVIWVVALAVVSCYLLHRRPQALVAQLLSLCAGFQSIAAVAWVFGFMGYDLTSPLRIASWLLSGVAYLLLWCCGIHFALIFPLRQPLAVRHPRLIPALYAVIPGVWLARVVALGLVAPARQPWAVVILTPTLVEQVIAQLLLVLFLVLGYRSCADPMLRAQMRLVGLAVGFAVVLFAAVVTIPTSVTGSPLLAGPLQALPFVPVALAIGAAVLRRQLLDLTVVINQSVTWLAMSVLVAGGYLAAVSILSLVFAHWFHLASSVVAGGVVAMAFQPVHTRVQRMVSRWTYGEEDPRRLATALAELIALARTPEEALSGAVRLIGTRLRLSTVVLETVDGGRFAWPDNRSGRPTVGESVPVVYQGRQLAAVLVTRPPERIRPLLVQRIIAHLSPQLGLMVHAAQLTAEARSIRDRIVLAREEERRHIYRDLHDGTAAALAATALHLQLVQAGLGPDHNALITTLGRLVEEVRAAADGVRRLMEDLSPPVLHELGLVKALREKATTYSTDQSNGLTIVVVEDHDLPESLPPAVEVAAFRIAVEAMINVVRHARARRCTVRLTFDGVLRIRVRDDGVGLPVPFAAGLGVRSIRDRAAELGGTSVLNTTVEGGTELLATLPVPVEPSPISPKLSATPVSVADHG
ncbi:MAG: hypothetical protein HOV87_20255 [Catenulispora sp.]|nr:hypothetical protein [Catenulispora sp.]